MDRFTSEDKGKGKRAFSEAAHPDAHLFEFMSYVKNIELDEEQKIELLRTVYQIMENFVDRGFSQDSIQNILLNSGDKRGTNPTQNPENTIELPPVNFSKVSKNEP